MSLEVVAGCMFAGKTRAIISRAVREVEEGRRAVVLKPAVDDRYSRTQVVSHDGQRFDAVDFRTPLPEGDLIIVDEAQFLDAVSVQHVLAVSRSARVVVAGLDLNWRGEPFGPMPVFLSFADTVVKLRATCAKCREPATRTQRVVDATDEILVGGTEAYEPRCLSCFDPPGANHA